MVLYEGAVLARIWLVGY